MIQRWWYLRVMVSTGKVCWYQCREWELFLLPSILVHCDAVWHFESEKIFVKSVYSTMECTICSIITKQSPVPVAERSAAVRLPGLRVRIPPVCLLWVLCVVKQRSVSGWSLVQRSPTECGVSHEWDAKPHKVRLWPKTGSKRHKIKS